MGQFWVKTTALSGSVLGDRQHFGFLPTNREPVNMPILKPVRLQMV